MKISEIDKDLNNLKTYEMFTSKHSSTKYLMVKINRKTSYIHKLVMERIIGRKLLNSERVDHINGDGTDNRRENLRVCTHQQNMGNQSSRKGSSIYKGVSKTRTGNWAARIWNNYKCINIGTFADEREAGKAYNQQAIKYFGEFAKLNQL